MGNLTNFAVVDVSELIKIFTQSNVDSRKTYRKVNSLIVAGIIFELYRGLEIALCKKEIDELKSQVKELKDKKED